MEQLKRLREARGLSQTKLAARADVNPATVNQIERGKREASPATLHKLAEALGVTLYELLEGESHPKASRRSSPEPSLFNGLEGERRENVYEPWAEFVNSFAERWERKIAEGVLDHGSVMEFVDLLDDLMPILGRLEREERQEQPANYPDTLGPVAGAAMERLLNLFNPLLEAGAKQVEDSDLARLRRRREQMVSEQERAASG